MFMLWNDVSFRMLYCMSFGYEFCNLKSCFYIIFFCNYFFFFGILLVFFVNFWLGRDCRNFIFLLYFGLVIVRIVKFLFIVLMIKVLLFIVFVIYVILVWVLKFVILVLFDIWKICSVWCLEW